MPTIYQGDKKIVDRYVGETLVTRAYQGDKLIFDAYSELTGTLPLYVRSRASQILQNYIIYGTASGIGDKTKNIFEIIPSELVVQGADSMEYEINAKSGSITISGTTPNSQFILKQRISVTSELAGRYYFSASFNQISPDNTFRAYLYNVTHGWTTEWDGKTRSPAITGSEYQEVLLVEGYVVEVTLNVYVNKSVNNVVFKPMLRAADTSANFEPYGYKLPITVTSNGTTTDYPVYIGDSKLMEGEYVDYEEQKIYKLVDGTLTPTDPPVPLPDITLPQGEVTIDTEEEFKYNSTIKGRINPVHYAYRINADTAEITYLADNKNFTPAAMGVSSFNYGSWENAFFMPKPCMLKSDGTVDYYLDPNDYSKKLDGTASDISDPTYDGNVMMEFPKIWYKFVPTGDDGEGGTFHCSNVKLDDDYECWCNYDANNNEIDHFYVAAYNGIILDGKMRSLSGYALTKENGADLTTGEGEIAAARANNQNGIDEWYTYLLADHQLLTYLATLMCKHVNHQTKFGRGIDTGAAAAKRAYVTGTLNDKSLFWGDTSTGTQAVKIFGIENFYACAWKRTAGLIGTSTGYVYKLTHGTKDGSTATSFNTNGSGYKTITRTKPANGWVTTMHYEPNGFWIPATTGTNRYYDYHYTDNGYALIGGSSNNASNCGSWYVSLNNMVSSSNWSISSALSCKPKA